MTMALIKNSHSTRIRIARLSPVPMAYSTVTVAHSNQLTLALVLQFLKALSPMVARSISISKCATASRRSRTAKENFLPTQSSCADLEESSFSSLSSFRFRISFRSMAKVGRTLSNLSSPFRVHIYIYI